MAAKGTAGKSASGASMSKYDMEVEARLQDIEAKLSKIVKWLEDNTTFYGH